MQGHIIKGYSGFYYVHAQGKLYECSLRGKNRTKDVRFLPGDLVSFTEIAQDKGVIESVLDRKNQLIRPAIANVDQLIIVAAGKDPLPDFRLIDRMSVIALYDKIEPVICFNKADLLNDAEREALLQQYESTGFPVIMASAATGMGIEKLQEILKGKISAFAGNSGVGKSSLLNRLLKQEKMQTGAISDKLKRGKHTTRHVEMFWAEENTLLADTPGFSALEIPKEIKREELSRYFPDFMAYLDECRFATCLHHHEPDCAVKQAVEKGYIHQSRYDNYLVFLQEVIAQERSY